MTKITNTGLINLAEALRIGLRQCERSETDNHFVGSIDNWLHYARNARYHEQHSPKVMADILAKLPVNDQIALVRGMVRDDFKALAAPWMQIWVSRNAKRIAELNLKGE